MTASEKRKRFRTLLAAPEIVAAPGCADALSALLAEKMGFQAIHASGSAAHRTRGYADAGLLDMTEMVDSLRHICDAVDVPVIGDADTGFGNVVNVHRTVKEYERAGAAAMHIEDQLTPKRPVHSGFEGAFITRQEMVDKIRSACDARTDEGLAIIARCDVPEPERTERLLACLEAGADVAWLGGGGTVEAIRSACDKLPPKPRLGVLPGPLTLQQYQEAGASCALIVGSPQIAMLAGLKGVLQSILDHGTAKPYLDSFPDGAEMAQFFNQMGTGHVKDLETRFGG
jgi:2-methylisocitrate lyase-like PEP mutase family enzyme